MLLDLCYAYTRAFNTGGVPCIENAWNGMCKAQCSKVMENAIESYSLELDKAIEELKYDPAKTKSANKEIIEKVIKTFKQNSIGEFAEEYEKMLRQSMKEKYEQAKKMADHKVTREYEDRLESMAFEFEEKIAACQYKQVVDIKIELEKWKEEEMKSLPKFADKEFLINKMVERLVIKTAEKISEQIQNTYSFEAKKEKERNKILEAQIEKYKLELESTKANYESKIDEVMKAKMTLETQTLMMNQKLSEIEKTTGEKDGKYSVKVSEYKECIKKLEEENAKYEKEVIRKTAECEKLSALSEQKVQYSDSRIRETNAKIEIVQEELHKSRTKLEEKNIQIKKLQETLESIQLSHESKTTQMKVAMEKEIASLKMQIEERRSKIESQERGIEKQYFEKLHESLKSAIDNNSKRETGEEMQLLAANNKDLSATISRMEKRAQALEQKVERMKRFQKMIKSSSALHCRYCSKTLPSEVFSAHLSVCTRDSSASNLKSFYQRLPLRIEITQSCIKEECKGRPFTEYLLHIDYNGKRWKINRKYRSFCELHERLIREYPQVKFPDTALQFATRNVADIVNPRRSGSIEDRKGNMQKYLSDLALIPLIRESASFRQFLGMDVQCPEEFENMLSVGASYFLSKSPTAAEEASSPD